VRAQRSVAVVSEAMARRYWPGASAIGRLLHSDDGAAVTVIGVARDAKVATLGEAPQPFVYRPLDADYSKLLRVIVRANGSAAGIESVLRNSAHAVDPAVAIFEIRTMTSQLDVMLFPYRVAALVSGLLGAFGLLLSSVGVFGVVAFGVARRTREIGIRLALGATPSMVLRMLLSEQARLAAVAIGVGVAMAVAVARLLAGVVFGVSWSDPITFVGVITALSAVAVVATYVPASRAMRVSPASALREE
jgi:putative ABC transport system permease protein